MRKKFNIAVYLTGMHVNKRAVDPQSPSLPLAIINATTTTNTTTTTTTTKTTTTTTKTTTTNNTFSLIYQPNINANMCLKPGKCSFTSLADKPCLVPTLLVVPTWSSWIRTPNHCAMLDAICIVRFESIAAGRINVPVGVISHQPSSVPKPHSLLSLVTVPDPQVVSKQSSNEAVFVARLDFNKIGVYGLLARTNCIWKSWVGQVELVARTTVHTPAWWTPWRKKGEVVIAG